MTKNPGSGTHTPNPPYPRGSPTKKNTATPDTVANTLKAASEAISHTEGNTLAQQIDSLRLSDEQHDPTHTPVETQLPDKMTSQTIDPVLIKTILDQLGFTGPSTKIHEIRINTPDVFSGDYPKAKEFRRACEAYLRLNDQVYGSDDKKITFVLSYMRNGRASEWAQYWTTKITSEPGIHSIHQFWTEFDKAFITTDAAGEARSKLYALRQSGTADEYNAQFQMLATQAGITEYTALVEPYQRGLKKALLDRIYNMNDLPGPAEPAKQGQKSSDPVMDYWYKAASRLDNQQRRLAALLTGQSGFYHQRPTTRMSR